MIPDQQTTEEKPVHLDRAEKKANYLARLNDGPWPW